MILAQEFGDKEWIASFLEFIRSGAQSSRKVICQDAAPW